MWKWNELLLDQYLVMCPTIAIILYIFRRSNTVLLTPRNEANETTLQS